MACATDPSAVSFFVNKTLAGDIPVVYFLRFLTGNPLISDAIHDFLLKSFDDCKKDVFGRAITAMTANWNTPARILQFQKFGEKMAPKLSQDEIRAFNQTLGSINAHASAFLLSRLDILRYLYDATAPIGNNPWTSRLPEDAVAVEAYELSILPYFPSKNFDYPDERNMTFDANSTVTFRALTELNSITIHSHRHVISSLDVKILKPRAKQVSIKSVTRDYKNAFLIVNLTEPIRAGSTVQMTFNYSGFIFVDPKSSGNMMNSVNFKGEDQKSWIFATDFEGGPGTRSLLPCFDEPSLKAKWQVTVTYPGEYTALSNTLEESVANIGNGLMQTKFKQTVPMSSYLLALTLGRYSSLNGVTAVDKKLVRIWTWTGMEQYCQQALKFAIDTIDYMTTTLNVSLPLEKFDIVALPQYTGSGSGAMENFGLVIAGYKEVMFDMDSSDTSSLIRVQEVVSHEIVHHWFGDFVTMDWWNHLFLNEGFATFWTPHILRAKSGQNSIADGTIMEIHRVVDHEGLNSGHPVTPAVQEIGGKYPLLTGVYSKASSIITTLKGVYSSDAVFFEGLSRYLKLHELKNADDLGLWRVMDSVAAVHGTPGWGDGEQTFNATEMMLPYTRQWSAPRVTVQKTEFGFRLSQSPITPVEHLPPSFYNYKWTIPLKILTSEGTRLFWLTERSQDLSVSNEQTLFVVNPGAETHVRIVYDDEAWKAVENVLKQDHTKVDETTRAVFLIDAYNDVRDQKISWERFLDSTVYLENEAGFLPWKSVLEPDGGFVYFLNSKLRFHPVYNNFKRYLEIISDKLPVNDLILSSDWSQNLLNSASLELKCMLGDSKCYALTFEKYTQFISQCAHSVDGTGKCNPSPPDFRPTQFCYGLKQQPETLDTLLNLTNWWLERLKIDSYFPQDLSAIFKGLACVEDIPQVFSLITWMLKSNKTGTFQFFDAIKTRDNGQNLFMYLLSHQEQVSNHKWFANYIGAMTADWASDEQLDNIKNFNWTSSLNVEQQDAVDTAISSIVSRRKWLETNGVVIQNWINNFVNSHDG